jgi:hypothetical protein
MADDATKTDLPNRVYAKWGFGDAPLKRKHREQFEAAIKSLLSLIAEQEFNASQLGNISIVKGLFSRSWKQDQWDWATVWRLLGRPSTNTSTHISHNLAELRRNIQTGDSASCSRVIQELRNAGIERLLKNFLEGRGGQKIGGEDSGHIYVLSTREQPRFLKIGFTSRDVEERVKEINSATGVIFPFGIRAVWEVDNAPQIEVHLHQMLNEFRVRSDREFFEIDFFTAKRLINQYLRDRRKEQENFKG